ncbi:MAG: AraC family transcriptional regulator [Firmicutes bacterium]|nr:AraC family transcriptional regulator [Bacillota bacterium]
MEFDIRKDSFTFKHSFSEKPDLSQERFKEHFHREYELLYFISGDASYNLQHRTYQIKPGSLLIAKPGEYHNIIFHSTAPYERYVIRFSTDALPPEIRSYPAAFDSVYYIKDTPLSVFITQMDQILPSLRPETRFTSCYGGLLLLLSLLASSDQLIQKADYVDSELRQMLRMIDRELPQIHSVDDIAGQLHMSRSAVYRLFASRMHTPVMTYVRTRKCMNARTMLAQGIPASKVAGALGFTHYSSFYRDYVNLFGESPSAPSVK